jgi:hypothetical protein
MTYLGRILVGNSDAEFGMGLDWIRGEAKIKPRILAGFSLDVQAFA